ncbi:aspartyl/asparaginyl beta-hydroxylase domain-containing protein [Parerythrobacter jejuensis]|uniref:Aspartyl/asparaginyl beta-hydroxylase domain-containing protein n=1 Tax=Parerythrobacter jejuensis TaxID=795812 RepID=A0A845APU4_9SPHN|nr:aspartyl/asparaginyl beta-hydroxylase domain-containing protein [Parerythrobacter jejuensis]MXP32330.1 aspartyl/asparaginyl beta-hydroxylase domain-containing protein [Parerythrobacter jejuensis]
MDDIDDLIAKADALLAAMDRRGALAFYQAALGAGEEHADSKRAALDHAQAMMIDIQRGMPHHIVESLDHAGMPADSWHPRFRESLAIMMGQRQRSGVTEAYPQLPTAYFYPGLPHIEFFDPTQFDWPEHVQNATEAIREEATQLSSEKDLGAYVKTAEDRPQGDVHGMLENDDWSTFDLTRKGQPDPERVGRYPATYSAITDNAPICDIPGKSPSVMFSKLKAGSRIPPHTGMINTRFICHLPLVVPGEGALRVGTQTRPWLEGELFIFDDTVEHEAWNNAGKDRLVLIFDIWRPEISAEERAQIRGLFAAVDSY